METNQALEKAAEEKTKGLAKDQPLTSTEKSRTNIGTAMRMDSMAKLIDACDDKDYFNACFKISTAWRIMDNPAKVKTSMRIWGYVGGSMEDGEAKAQDIMDEYHKWRNWTTIRKMIDKRLMAIGVCALGQTFTELGWSYNIDPKTAKKYAMEGVQAWVDANKKPKGRRELRLIEPEREFIPTRIVQFVD